MCLTDGFPFDRVLLNRKSSYPRMHRATHHKPDDTHGFIQHRGTTRVFYQESSREHLITNFSTKKKKKSNHCHPSNPHSSSKEDPSNENNNHDESFTNITFPRTPALRFLGICLFSHSQQYGNRYDARKNDAEASHTRGSRTPL